MTTPMKIIILILPLFLPLFSMSQSLDSIVKEQNVNEVRVDRNYHSKYKYQLGLLKKTYPMALKAKQLIDEYENDLAKLDKKRMQRKYSKQMHKKLKDDFTYSIRDLYRSEGRMLMKLVYRETGMTVNQILENYRNKFQTAFYGGVASIFGQNLDATYDGAGEDWITEMVIKDIKVGNVAFDTTMKSIDKEAYKSDMKEYRNDRRNSRKGSRKSKRNKKARDSKSRA